MEDVKRGRGRPKGSGENDTEGLMAVARLITADPKLKRTTAMKAVLRTRRDWKAASDGALIRRWQVKWKAVGASYMQRVQDERAAAEAERQRRERVAAEARERGRKSWPEIMAEAREAGRMPGLTVSKELREIFERHDRMMGSLPQWRALAVRNALPKMGLTAFEAFADAKRYGLAGGDALSGTYGAMHSHGLREALRQSDMMGLAGRVSTLDNSGLGDTMRKYGEMGRTLADVSTLTRLSKLPSDF